MGLEILFVSRFSIFGLMLALLTSCGGGGGSALVANLAPSLQVSAALFLREGETQVTTVSAVDSDSLNLNFTISGADAALFSLDSDGVLRFNQTAVFEAAGDNQYQLTLSVSDGEGGSDSRELSIAVLNLVEGRVVDGPVSGSKVFFDSNGNFRLDANESFATTDINGFFQLADDALFCSSNANCDVLIVASGGTDISSTIDLPNLVLVGRASADRPFAVSPLSSILATAEDPAAVLSSLGISGDSQAIFNQDPWSAAETGVAGARAVLQVNQALGLLINSLASLLGPTLAPDAITRLTAEFNLLAQAGTPVALTDATLLATILSAATQNTLAASIVSAAANTIADVNRALTDPTLTPTGTATAAIIGTTQLQLQASITAMIEGSLTEGEFTQQNSAVALVGSIAVSAGLVDTDTDQIVDIVDDDDDGDGALDNVDAFPLDKFETVDTDADGTGNNADTDDDNDGVDDRRDAAPLDNTITPPTAIISSDLEAGLRPLGVVFDASNSIAGFDADTITNYTWNFGDGSSSTEQVAPHIFFSDGSFTVQLTLTNSDGLSDVTSRVYTVEPYTALNTIAGSITIASTLTVDSDVNDSRTEAISNNSAGSAQLVTNPVIVGGFASEVGAGPNFDGQGNLVATGDEFDGYRFNALGGEVVNLRIATRGLGDLDLLLFDLNQNLIDFSASADDNESLVVPAGVATYNVVVQSFSGYSNYILSIGNDPLLASNPAATASAEFTPGELIIQPAIDAREGSNLASFAPDMPVEASSIIGANAPGYSGSRLYVFGERIVGALAPAQQALIRGFGHAGAPSLTELKLATLLAAKQMTRQGDIAYAEPNFQYRALLEPNDTLYPRQWHYRSMNLPAAWDQTTGSADITLAVLDSGIVTRHPDLQARLSSDSYDFISSRLNGGDGDGLDSDASDPGDGRDNSACGTSSNRTSSFHGTHVAGTMGALSNNGQGVSGVDWAASIMNLRVLGCLGGSTFDIVTALLYAAGIENASGLLPSKAADVANLSLGGPSPSQSMREAVLAARAAGLIIIAAAGNEGNNELSYPASYEGVVSVAATSRNDQRAPYSQFNAQIDLAAPGGDKTADLDADGFPDGVLSSHADSSGAMISSSYDFLEGTSMASPHVAGVVGLMKAVNPDMTPAQLDQLIGSGEITIDLGSTGRDDEYGFGRLDASLAVLAARALLGGNIPAPSTPRLGVSLNSINFGVNLTERNLTVFNAGSGEISVTGMTSDSARLSIEAPASGDGTGNYVIRLARDDLLPGIYESLLTVSSNVGDQAVMARYEVFASTQQADNTAGLLYVFLYNIETGEFRLESYSPSAGNYRYEFTDVVPGVYFILAGSDPDNDGETGAPGEALGVYPTRDSIDVVIVNRSYTGIDFSAAYRVPFEANNAQSVGERQPKITGCGLQAITGSDGGCLRLQRR